MTHDSTWGRRSRAALAAALLGGLAYALPAQAGPYADDLSKCLVSSTSKDDRAALVTWMFAAASAHPAVKSLATVTPKQLDDANKRVAGLFMHLLTESCKSQTEQAMQYEGASTLQASFQVLGQVAGQELFASPEVGAAMAGLGKYVDEARLKELGQAKK